MLRKQQSVERSSAGCFCLLENNQSCVIVEFSSGR
ncbi:MAG: DUF3709 domain-containing protein [Brevibacillus sp.]|nr:DUF3709 domain-containing protein [Brevibacillus sp.]